MMNSRKIGDKGEKFTLKYLKKNKYKIIVKNYETYYGEIDIIAKKDEYICFIEVKTRKNTSFFRPLAAINRHKKDCIIKSAYSFLKRNDFEDFMPRFDIAEVIYDENDKYSINYIENAFDLNG